MSRSFATAQVRSKADQTRLILISSSILVVVFSLSAYFLLSNSTPEEAEASVAQQPAVQASIESIQILVPLEEIDSGTLLSPDMFRVESRPLVAVPESAVKSIEEITGQYARSLIVPGQIMQRELMTSVRPANQVTANIPSGFRAVTIRVDARTSVEGFVRPGAKVDVVWATYIRGEPSVTVIVQNAKVLSAERSVDSSADPNVPVPSTVTLLVSARDASKIQLASTEGKLSLSLRGDEDDGRGDSAGPVTRSNLLAGPQVDKTRHRSTEGTVSVGGKRYFVRNGRLIPDKD